MQLSFLSVYPLLSIIIMMAVVSFSSPLLRSTKVESYRGKKGLQMQGMETHATSKHFPPTRLARLEPRSDESEKKDPKPVPQTLKDLEEAAERFRAYSRGKGLKVNTYVDKEPPYRVYVEAAEEKPGQDVTVRQILARWKNHVYMIEKARGVAEETKAKTREEYQQLIEKGREVLEADPEMSEDEVVASLHRLRAAAFWDEIQPETALEWTVVPRLY
jgi:hypothetical protein